ncbi:MAG: RNA-binding S4 domain-containing protein [Candidatus Marinimicrobia bacterium]|nr:RNA-binding S4 domain-containing protein [Candidatus Neomarinimicrobiota bacterium]
MKRHVEIDTEYIKLSNLLQLADVVGTGGQAKLIIQDRLVKVNDEWCTQRGRKIYPGDKVNVILEPATEITVNKSEE